MKLFTAVTGEPCPQLDEYNPFASLCSEVVPVQFTYEMDPDGVLVLWGGEDISPALYGHKPIPYSGPEHLSMRDRKEYDLAKFAMKHNMPIIGVCRGAQFMCAMAGGALYQHVDGHATGHEHDMRVSKTGEIIEVNSYHHQMLEVSDTEHRVVAYAPKHLSGTYQGDHRKLRPGAPIVEPEVVVFPHIRTLAIQFHPEWLEPDSRAVQFCLEQAKEILS